MRPIGSKQAVSTRTERGFEAYGAVAQVDRAATF